MPVALARRGDGALNDEVRLALSAVATRSAPGRLLQVLCDSFFTAANLFDLGAYVSGALVGGERGGRGGCFGDDSFPNRSMLIYAVYDLSCTLHVRGGDRVPVAVSLVFKSLESSLLFRVG